MKSRLLPFLLGSLGCCLVCARAQTPVAAPAPVAAASTFGAPLPSPNGFDLLKQANLASLRGVEGDLRLSEDSPDAPNARRQRAAVERNAAALKLVHQALQLPIMHPPLRDLAGFFGADDVMRPLAGLLKQESAVRLSLSDREGALNSSLDCIALGVLMTRGASERVARTGRDIEALGRSDLELIVKGLNAPQCRAAAARVRAIEAQRPPFADALLVERAAALNFTRQAFEQEDWTQVVAQVTKPDGSPFTADETESLSVIGQGEVQANLTRTFTALISRAQTPWGSIKTGVSRAADPWSRLFTDNALAPSSRAEYEAARAQNELLAFALELQAAKKQSGAYPDAFLTAADPFADPSSAAPRYIYRREQNAYRLYSVGPNGRDDGGQSAPASAPPVTAPSATAPDDLSAPVFSR